MGRRAYFYNYWYIISNLYTVWILKKFVKATKQTQISGILTRTPKFWDHYDVKVCGFIKHPRWQVSRSQGAQTWITQINLQTTPCLTLSFVRVDQIAPPRTVVTTSSCSLLLTCRPRWDKRLSWPRWLTYSRRFTHISGHPSGVGRAQDSDSSPVKD